MPYVLERKNSGCKYAKFSLNNDQIVIFTDTLNNATIFDSVSDAVRGIQAEAFNVGRHRSAAISSLDTLHITEVDVTRSVVTNIYPLRTL